MALATANAARPADTDRALRLVALGATHTCFAQPGARVRDVLAERLEPALAVRPDVVTLLIGLNDVLRSSSCAMGAELTQVLRPFRGTTVLVARLHDPTELLLLPLPRPARTAVLRRVGLLNDSVDTAVEATGAQVLDLAGLPALRRRNAWAVDRLHPNAHGHAVIASAAAAALGFASLPPVPPAGRASGRLAELVWLTRHGLPHLAVHGRRMAPGALAALARR